MQLEISIDDAGIEDIRIAEIIAKNGLEKNTVFYWPVMPRIISSTKGRLSLLDSQMDDIASSFEIGSHTITHRLLTRIPQEEAAREIVESKHLLEARFEQPITKFCWPRGYTNPDLKKIAQDAGYECARGVNVGGFYTDDNYNQMTTAHLGYNRKEYGGLPWFEYTMRKLEQYPTGDGRAIIRLWMHGYEMGQYPDAFYLFDDLLYNIKQRMKQ
jgi:peptidoglycan/xylan/chitin deacetylase (PgdA/CDA1 family)